MKQLFQFIKIHIIQQITLQKIMPALLFLSFFLYPILQPTYLLIPHYQRLMSVGVISLSFVDPTILFVIMTGFMLMVNHLPYRNPLQVIMTTKTGSAPWMISQMIFIMFFAFVYVFLVIIIYLCIFRFHLDFSNEWGALIRSVAQGFIAPIEPVSFQFDSLYLQHVTPYAALAQSLSILYLNLILIGWVTLVGNLFKVPFGAIISMSLVFLHAMFIFQNGLWIQFVSPITWTNPYLVRFTETSGLLTYPQILVRLFGLLGILMIILFVSYKKNRGFKFYGT